MKKVILLIFAAVPFMAFPQAKFIATWEGKLNVGHFSLRLGFHVKDEGNGKISATMDSPDQNIFGKPCDDVLIKEDSITIEIKKIHGGYSGRMTNDSTLEGNWEQGGKALPMTMKKVAVIAKLVRPQTPVPPYSYNSEDVEYDNADKTLHYGATFSYPKTQGPFPTAILITGSGQQDRDETIFGHKPFAVIADYLTKKGFAVLRVDDRGAGKSTGNFQQSTTADFAKDVETGLAWLRTRKEVDPKKLGMIGHSEGGLIEDIIAARDHSIDFVIMLAGPGMSGAEVLTKQNIEILESGGVPAKAANAYGEMYKKVTEDAIVSSSYSQLYNMILTDFRSWKTKQPESILKDLKLSSDTTGETAIVKQFAMAFSSSWEKYFLAADPAPLIEQFTCKALALDGGKDLQVNPKANLDAIHHALEKSKSPKFETKEIPGLNHLFQRCKKCTIEEYQEL